MVEAAKKCYMEFPTIVNALGESGITYRNIPIEYANMDNKFAKSRRGIGESSNLAMLALSYYWTNPTKELYDNFVILSVLAQIIIDGCKREYEVDGVEEIARIKRMKCMTIIKEKKINAIDIETGEIIERTIKEKKDFPRFMLYTKEVKFIKNGKERSYEDVKSDKDSIKNRLNKDIKCPMNYLEETIDKIQGISTTTTTPTEEFFIKMKGKANSRTMSKIRTLIEEYNNYVINTYLPNKDDEYSIIDFKEKTDLVIEELKKMKIKNIVTINRLIETALSIEKNNNKNVTSKNNSSYTRKILNLLYKYDKERFLMNFN